MSEKKVVNKDIAIGLGVLCVILIIGLFGVIANYTSIIRDKDSAILTKDSQIQMLTSQKNQLQTWLDGNITILNSTTKERDNLWTWLNGNITYYSSQINSLNSQIVSIQNQVDILKAPKIITIDLKADDTRPWPTPYLHIYGHVCNVGTNTAYNCTLHVIGYQSGGVRTFDTYIVLGDMIGESSKNIDSNIYYSGSALTAWTITPEWSTIPVTP